MPFHRPPWAPIKAGEYRLVDDMFSHGMVQHGLVRRAQVGQQAIESMEVMHITVHVVRRARAAIAGSPPIVLSLPTTVGQGRGRDALGQAADAGRDVVEQPVGPGLLRCIGVFNDQRQALGFLRPVHPHQGWRQIPAIARIAPGNEAVVAECLRQECKSHRVSLASTGWIDAGLVRAQRLDAAGTAVVLQQGGADSRSRPIPCRRGQQN